MTTDSDTPISSFARSVKEYMTPIVRNILLLSLMAGVVGFVSAIIVMMIVWQVVFIGDALGAGTFATVLGFVASLPLSIVLRNFSVKVIVVRVGVPALVLSAVFALSGNFVWAMLGAVLGVVIGVFWAFR